MIVNSDDNRIKYALESLSRLVEVGLSSFGPLELQLRLTTDTEEGEGERSLHI